MSKATEKITQTKQPAYPIVKEDGWFIEDESDEVMGIETNIYNNGSTAKRCRLSDGRIAICHSLRGKDRVMIKRIAGNDQAKFQDAVTVVATKIDDAGIVLEDLDGLLFKDFTKLQTMASSINF